MTEEPLYRIQVKRGDQWSYILKPMSLDMERRTLNSLPPPIRVTDEFGAPIPDLVWYR